MHIQELTFIDITSYVSMCYSFAVRIISKWDDSICDKTDENIRAHQAEEDKRNFSSNKKLQHCNENFLGLARKMLTLSGKGLEVCR